MVLLVMSHWNRRVRSDWTSGRSYQGIRKQVSQDGNEFESK
jgi:hypothetical protein